MTAYVVFDEIKAGRLAMDTQITVSATAAGQPPTKFGLKKGQKLTVKQALSAMLVTSANDAAVALAEQVGGSEIGFVGRMNAAAQKLGMISTRYQNATGLPNDGQVTTARDMALLALHVIHDFPDRYALFGDHQATVAGRTLPTVNALLTGYPGADGMKTGFTCGSGYNVIGSALRGDRRLVAVLLGAHDRNDRAAKIKKLLDSGFAGGETVPSTFSNIAMIPAALDAGTPPVVLNGSECAATDSVDSDGNAAPSKLPGWGIIFGAYPDPKKAQQVIGDMKKKMKGELKGRPTVVLRQYEGSKKYAALLVGLSGDDAGKTCRMVWHRGQYCLALNPVVLNDPSALWR
jgi:D-alanyl-D-alanine carboxypeptidase